MTRAARLLFYTLLAATAAVADDSAAEDPNAADALTDIEFFEYLGSWKESDAEWLVLATLDEDAAEWTDTPGKDEEEDLED